MEGKILESSKTNRWSIAKDFLKIFLPLSALIVGTSILIYYAQVRSERIIVESREKDSIALARKAIVKGFDSLVSDLIILSKNKQLQKFLQTEEYAHLEPLSEEFLSYCENKRLYDQVRFLDETGMEILRINFNNGNPNIVPKDQLQNKSKRYYFKDAFNIKHGEIFVSPFDLNIERGEIEKPLKPMIRFGTPVFDINGRKRGIVLLNYLGAKLINDLEDITGSASGQIALLNSDGFWLKGPMSEDEWGFMYEDGSNRRFGMAFPGAWQRIHKAENGQFRIVGGMFTFTTIYPLAEAHKSSTGSGRAFEPSDDSIAGKNYYWKVVSHVSPDLLNAESRDNLRRLAFLDLFAVVVLAIVSLFLGRANRHRKRAEEALRESEEKFQTVANFAYDWEYWVAPDGRHIYVSPSCKRITGYAPDDFQNNPGLMVEIIHPDDRAIFTKHNQEIDESGKVFPVDFRIITKSGDERWIGHICQSVYDTDGGFIGRRGSNRDITEQKRLQNQLQQTQKMEAVGTLAGGIAHQFNNALYAITGNIDLLEMDFLDNENVSDYAKEMKTSTHRMTQLTAQLLAYARGGRYQTKTISLSDFVKETLPLVKHTIDSAIQVDTDLPCNILNVNADLTQLQMVLSAVLANSSEAIEGEGHIRIACRNKMIKNDTVGGYPGLKTGNYACLTVTDNGKGMNEETGNRVFEPFFTTKFEGRGLGMAAAFGIVKNHDGLISVDSELGQGTIVKIYLPAVETPVKEDSKPKPKTVWIKGTGTILVIEDEEPVMEISRAILEKLGYRVLEARTGQEAIDVVKTFDGHIDLALLDILLPDMSGNDIYPLIMEARPDLKVIVFSGYSIDGPAREILNAGAENFIQKPLTIAALSEKLKKTLEGGQ